MPQAPASRARRPRSQTCRLSSDMLRNMLDAALGRQVDGDGGAGADGAGDVEGPAVDADQLDGERKAAGPGRAGDWDDARASMPGISVTSESAPWPRRSPARPCPRPVSETTRRKPPVISALATIETLARRAAVNLMPLETRLSSTCFSLRSSPRSSGSLWAGGDAAVAAGRPRRGRAPGASTSFSILGTVMTVSSSLSSPASMRGHVEQIVDDLQQMLGARQDVAGIFVISGIADGPQQLDLHHLGEADDGVERRAQLMAGVGEEVGLAVVGRFRLVLGPGQRILGLLARRDVEGDADDVDHLAAPCAAAPWW